MHSLLGPVGRLVRLRTTTSLYTARLHNPPYDLRPITARAPSLTSCMRRYTSDMAIDDILIDAHDPPSPAPTMTFQPTMSPMPTHLPTLSPTTSEPTPSPTDLPTMTHMPTTDVACKTGTVALSKYRLVSAEAGYGEQYKGQLYYCHQEEFHPVCYQQFTDLYDYGANQACIDSEWFKFQQFLRSIRSHSSNRTPWTPTVSSSGLRLRNCRQI